MACNQCQQLRINGVVCHEHGCPNIKRARRHSINSDDRTVCGVQLRRNRLGSIVNVVSVPHFQQVTCGNCRRILYA